MTDRYPIILTEKEREAIIHCSRLRRGLIGNPKHKEHQEWLEWVGGEFDPEEFDLEAVNQALEN